MPTVRELVRHHLPPPPAYTTCARGKAQREFFTDNLLVRIHLIIENKNRPVLRHGSLKSLFQVALYLPS